MGCISCKLAVVDGDGEERRSMVLCAVVRDCPDHVVSLTSTSYGALKLDDDEIDDVAIAKELPNKYRAYRPPTLETPEVINAWELMKGLEDESPVRKVAVVECTPGRRQRKANLEVRRYGGKENGDGSLMRNETKPLGLGSPVGLGSPLGSIENTPRVDGIGAVRRKSDLKTQRRSLGRMFDPDLIAAFERELCRERAAAAGLGLLESYEKKCPPGGEGAVVLYTTTLRGIRKTFEGCNAARSAIESHGVQVVERDVSMDSGFREELRLLMDPKEARVPALFVKGRWIGGADEVLRLEEDGKLELLLDGVPKALGWRCDGCGGMRFLLCMDCNGSCKLLDDDQQMIVKCGECNENGLIHCPICS